MMNTKNQKEYILILVAFLAAFLFFVCGGSIAQAQEKTWTGEVSEEWSNGDNWSDGNTPDSSSDVVIPDAATTSNDPNINGICYCKNISIKSGGILNGGSNVLFVSGDWTNNGTFNADTGGVIFVGSGDSTIAGTNATTFYNLHVHKADITKSVFITTNNCSSSHQTWVDSGALDFSNADVTFTSSDKIEFSNGGLSSCLLMDADDTLDCSDSLIFNSGATEDINAGTIRVASYFEVDTGADFTPTGGEVVFDGASGSGINCVDPSAAFYDLEINKSPGISAAAHTNVMVSGNFTITSGIFDTNGFDMSIAGDWTNNDTINSDSSKVTFYGLSNINSGGTGAGKAFYNVELDGTSATLSTNDIDIDGDFTITSGTWNSNGLNMSVAGDWTNNGMFNPGSSTVTFDGTVSQTINTGGTAVGKAFYNVVIDNSDVGYGAYLHNGINIGGDFTINASRKFSVTDGITSYDMYVSGSWTNNGTFDPGSSTVTFKGTVSQTINTGGTAVGKAFYNVVIDNSDIGYGAYLHNGINIGGDFTINAGRKFSVTDGITSYDMYVSGNWTNNGTFDPGSGTVTFESTGTIGGAATDTFYNLTVAYSGQTTKLTKNITVDNDFTVGDGTYNGAFTTTLKSYDYPIVVSPGATIIDGTIELAPSADFHGFGSYISANLNRLQVNSPTHTITMADDVSCNGDLDVTAGTLDANGFNINVGGNWTNNDTFIPGSGTVTLTGSGSLISGGTSAGPFYNLTVSSGTRQVTVNSVKVDGKLTIDAGAGFSIMDGGLNLYTGEGGSIDVDIDGTLSLDLSSGSGSVYWYVNEGTLVDLDSSGTLVLDGFDDSKRVYLRSSADGNPWYLNDHTFAGNNPFIDYVDVKDSDASSGNIIDASGGTSIDSGNNKNWIFTSVIFVDINAPTPGPGDGTSWYDAYKYLQDALAAAEANDQIWVAEGTYKPDVNAVYPEGTGERTATFQLTISGVNIYGGFPSGGGSWEQRDWQSYPTILSGDLNDNDAQDMDPCDLLNHPTRADNSNSLITAMIARGSLVDGFSITGGNCCYGIMLDDCNGGGMRCLDSNIEVTNCYFWRCAAAGDGGAVWSGGWSAPRSFTYCTFHENFAAAKGGGMYNYNTNTAITNCIFSRNAASKGSAIYNDNNDTPLPSTAPSITGSSVTDCWITVSFPLLDGGGIYNYKSDPNITNCTFTRNSVGNKGGGIYNNDSDPNITNCILWGNTDGVSPNEQAQIYDDFNSSSVVKYSCIEGLNIYDGNNNIGDNPLFLADIPDQVRLLANSPCIDAGDNNSVPVDLTADIEGHPRIIDGDCNTTEIVDMGAYEFDWVHVGDFAGGYDVDFVDFAYLGLTWLKEQGEPDYNYLCDISIPADSIIDEWDLKIFTDNWLAGK